jgi:hypothetical protein
MNRGENAGGLYAEDWTLTVEYFTLNEWEYCNGTVSTLKTALPPALNWRHYLTNLNLGMADYGMHPV